MSTPTENQIAVLEQKLFDLEGRLETKSSRLDDVATMGLMLTSILEIEKVLAAFMEMATRMVSAEVGSLMLQESGVLQTKISWGLEDAVVKTLAMENSVDISAWVMENGQTVVINDFDQQTAKQAHIKHIMAVPIASRENRIGVLIVVNKTTGELFSDEDRDNLEILVRFAAAAIENANLLQEHLEKQKLEQELELASQVQRALLPAQTETFDGAALDAYYRPAGHVGGDYYDVIGISPTEFIVIVGDVSSKGVPAALMMVGIRSAFRLQAGKDVSLSQLIGELNSFLCEQVLRTESMFISLVYAHFDLTGKTCTYVNAGHLPPVQFNPESDLVHTWTKGGTILGQFPDFQFQSETRRINSGDKILFYTDGVTESINPTEELYGRERLRRYVRRNAALAPATFTEGLVAEIESFTGKGRPLADDLTTLVVAIL